MWWKKKEKSSFDASKKKANKLDDEFKGELRIGLICYVLNPPFDLDFWGFGDSIYISNFHFPINPN